MNRRNFLKGMMGIVGASVAAKIAHLEIPGHEMEPAAEVIPDEVLDAPVTPDNPLCWVELDGVRYGLADAQIDLVNHYDSYITADSPFVRHVRRNYTWEIRCGSYQVHAGVVERLYSGKALDCVVGLTPYGRYGGQVYMTEYSTQYSPRGKVESYFTLQGVGDLKFL